MTLSPVSSGSLAVTPPINQRANDPVERPQPKINQQEQARAQTPTPAESTDRVSNTQNEEQAQNAVINALSPQQPANRATANPPANEAQAPTQTAEPESTSNAASEQARSRLENNIAAIEDPNRNQPTIEAQA